MYLFSKKPEIFARVLVNFVKQIANVTRCTVSSYRFHCIYLCIFMADDIKVNNAIFSWSYYYMKSRLQVYFIYEALMPVYKSKLNTKVFRKLLVYVYLQVHCC